MTGLMTAGGANGPLAAGGLLTPVPAPKTSAYTAAPGDFVTVDTTGGAVTITLPTQPADQALIGVKLVNGGSKVTVAAGGADVFHLFNGSVTSYTLAALYQGALYQYQAALGVWHVFDLAGQLGSGASTGSQASKVVALTDGASIAVSAALGNDFRVTIAGNRTIAVPSNPTDGQAIRFQITQDATGSRTLTWTSTAGGYDFGTSGAPTLTVTAAKTDILRFVYNATAGKWFYDGSQLGM